MIDIFRAISIMALYDKGVVHFCTRLFSYSEYKKVREGAALTQYFFEKGIKRWKQWELEKRHMIAISIRQEKVWKMLWQNTD